MLLFLLLLLNFWCKSTGPRQLVSSSDPFLRITYSLQSTYENKSHKLTKYDNIYLAGTGSLGQREDAFEDIYSEGFSL